MAVTWSEYGDCRYILYRSLLTLLRKIVKHKLENGGLLVASAPDNNDARHDSRTPWGSRVRTRMQQSRAHLSKNVRGISVRRICVAVRVHSCRHASLSNETYRKLRYIKFNNRWSHNLFSNIFTERNFGFHTKNSSIHQSPTNLFYLFIRIFLSSKIINLLQNSI